MVVHFHGQSQEILFSQLHSHPESLFLYLKTLVEVHTTGNLKFSCLRKDGSLHFPSGRMAKHQSDRIKTFLEELNDFPKLLRSKPIQLIDEVTEHYLEVSISSTVDEVLERMNVLLIMRVASCCHICSMDLYVYCCPSEQASSGLSC